MRRFATEIRFAGLTCILLSIAYIALEYVVVTSLHSLAPVIVLLLNLAIGFPMIVIVGLSGDTNSRPPGHKPELVGDNKSGRRILLFRKAKGIAAGAAVFSLTLLSYLFEGSVLAVFGIAGIFASAFMFLLLDSLASRKNGGGGDFTS